MAERESSQCTYIYISTVFKMVDNNKVDIKQVGNRRLKHEQYTYGYMQAHVGVDVGVFVYVCIGMHMNMYMYMYVYVYLDSIYLQQSERENTLSIRG